MQHWLKPITLFTVTALTLTNPLGLQKALAINEDAQDLEESVEIFVPPPVNGKSGVCQAFLEPAINEIINKASLKKTQWGILVQSLDGRTTFYQHNANRHLIPASNMKLLTTAAALLKLDPEVSIRSKSLREWVAVTNLRSNNFYANTLLRYIGGSEGAEEALNKIGVDPSGYRIADGSGLSRRNLATPKAIVNILQGMKTARNNETFMASLPVAGLTGTLKNRLRSTPAQGVIHAKTGTLKGVRALSGYIDHPQYGMMAFSIIANNPKVSGKVLVKAIDEIALNLSMVTPCH